MRNPRLLAVRFGLCKDHEILELPIPQNKNHIVRHSSGTGQNINDVSHDHVIFIPVLNQPLSSNRYYAIQARGKHTGFPTQIAKLISGSIMWNYINLFATHLKWAWNFLLYHSIIQRDVQKNGAQISSIIEYKPVRGSEENGRGGEESECAVCLCKIEEGEEIGELRCDHVFHRVCLERWIGYRHGTCPLCRAYLAPATMLAQLGEEVLFFQYSSFSSRNRTAWWLR